MRKTNREGQQDGGPTDLSQTQKLTLQGRERK